MKKLMLIVMHMSIMITFFLLSIRFIGLEMHFFRWFYAQNNTALELGLSYQDLMLATQQLLDYMLDRSDTIQVMVNVNNVMVPMFNQREIDHMIDVLHLVRIMRIFMASTFVLTLITWWSLRHTRNISNIILSSYNTALAFMVGFIGAIGVFAITDFESFWIMFHEVLFTNDLWLLNPQTDRMINMVPLNFFMTLVFSILVTGILLNVGYALVLRKVVKRERAQ